MNSIEIQALLDAASADEEALREQYERCREIILRLQDRQRSLRAQAEHKREEATRLKQELALQLKREEDDIPEELIREYIDALKLTQHHERLFQFQLEDLLFMFGRHKFKERYRGILNANATGLGKTAETCAFIKTLQVMEEDNATADR